MAKIYGLVELLHTLLDYVVDDLVLVDKSTLLYVLDCIQDFKDTLEFV